jgi:nucleotide-binding universal stress UspA family protein
VTTSAARFVPAGPRFLHAHLPEPFGAIVNVAPPMYGGLRRLATTLGEHRATLEMRAGNPADHLAAVAEDVGADLICIGRGRNRHGTARFGGSTLYRLLRRTTLPVLVATGEMTGQPTHVLAAVDDGPSGRHVAETAWQLGMQFEARLTAMHVLDPTLAAYVRSAQEADDGSQRPETSERSLLTLTEAWLRLQLTEAGAPRWRTYAIAVFGDAGQELVAHASRSRAGLVVLGRAADTADSCAALGSVARLVLWASPCPVIVLGNGGPRDAELERGADIASKRRSLGRGFRSSALGAQPEPRPPDA